MIDGKYSILLRFYLTFNLKNVTHSQFSIIQAHNCWQVAPELRYNYNDLPGVVYGKLMKRSLNIYILMKTMFQYIDLFWLDRQHLRNFAASDDHVLSS